MDLMVRDVDAAVERRKAVQECDHEQTPDQHGEYLLCPDCTGFMGYA